MQIFVDADACPNVIKEILFKASLRLKLKLYLVANQFLPKQKSEYIINIKVPQGFDVADNYIIENIKPGDLAITADIPLAASIVAQGAFALNPRGTMYTKDNIKQIHAMRNVVDELRSSGQITGGPPTLTKQDRLAFANALDRFLTKNISPS